MRQRRYSPRIDCFARDEHFMKPFPAARRRLALAGAALLASSLLAPPAALAQAYPARPVRIIVPFAAGGDSDTFARVVADKFAEKLGQPAVVDNRPGAGGVLGFNVVKDAAPDGYTIGLISSGNTSLPALMKAFPQDWYRQVAPVAMIQSGALVLATNTSVPVKTLPEFIRYAKQRPGKLNIGSPGGSVTLYAELLKARTGLDLEIVNYKGSAPAQMGNLANEVQLTFESFNSAKAHFATGKLVPIAVGSARRSPLLPGVPTVAETLPGVEYTFWLGLVAPAATPRDVIEKLNAAIGQIVQMPDVVKRITDAGSEPLTLSPAAMARQFESETQLWTKVARDAKLEPQ